MFSLQAPTPPDQVIALFLADQSATIGEIAHRLGLSIRAVADILDSDESRLLLETIHRLATLRAQLVAAEVRTEAIHITRRIANTAANPETARRAAAALIRLQTLPTPRRDPVVTAAPADGADAPDPAPAESAQAVSNVPSPQRRSRPRRAGPTPRPPEPRAAPDDAPDNTPVLAPEALLAAREALSALAGHFFPHRTDPISRADPDPPQRSHHARDSPASRAA